MTGHPVDLSADGADVRRSSSASCWRRRDWEPNARRADHARRAWSAPAPDSRSSVIERISGVRDGRRRRGWLWSTLPRRFADGALGLAVFDFERNGYSATWRRRRRGIRSHTNVALSSPWDVRGPTILISHNGGGDLALRFRPTTRWAGAYGRCTRAVWLQLPGTPWFRGSAAPRPTRLGPRARRLRDHRRVASPRGVRVSSHGPTTTCARSRCWRW